MQTLSYDKHPINSKSQIRLLEFRYSASGLPQWNFRQPVSISADGKAEVACPFIAASYEWGNPDDVAPFMIDGEAVELRRNLINFLHAIPRLRDKQDLPALFWIDSMCINQDDVEEKTNQIQLLKNIYSSATCVLSWLGSVGAGSNLAMKYLCGVDVEAERSVNALLNRRYWTRLWMVQEVVLGRQWYVACGSDIIDGKCLGNHVLGEPTNSRVVFHHSRWQDSKAYNLISERERFMISGPLPLLDLMLRFFELEAEFRVDNIRALLALSKPDTIGNLHGLLGLLVNSSGDADRTETVIRDICYEMGLLTRLESAWNTPIPSGDLMRFVRSLLDGDIAKKGLCMLAEGLRCSRIIIKLGPQLISLESAASSAVTVPPFTRGEGGGERQVAHDRSMPRRRQGARTQGPYMPSYLARSSITRSKVGRKAGVATYAFALMSSDCGNVEQYIEDERTKRRENAEEEYRMACMKKENEELMKTLSKREWFKLRIQEELFKERDEELEKEREKRRIEEIIHTPTAS
jgi:hypothetical protein